MIDTIEAFRAAGRPVVHVVRFYQPGGSDAERVRRALLAGGVELVAPHSPGSRLADGLLPPGAPELDPELLRGGGVQQVGERDHIIYKPRWGAFHRTPLERLLGEWGVDSLVVVGCNLPNCPRATLIEASERDFRVAVVPEAMSQVSAQGLEEVRQIGVRLLDLPTVRRALAAAAPRLGAEPRPGDVRRAGVMRRRGVRARTGARYAPRRRRSSPDDPGRGASSSLRR
ncbi:cysteine hydrolase family protein [Micromonospora sp. URMC 105]|uniref:cysteine hydrolase family protein n=1 Tax=Micromonospora sp. URMC 105 TaxID=3423413 RepID=UPI003F1C8684